MCQLFQSYSLLASQHVGGYFVGGEMTVNPFCRVHNGNYNANSRRQCPLITFSGLRSSRPKVMWPMYFT